MKRSQLVERILTLEGKPFSFKNREMFRLIYDRPQANAVLMMGRQMGKSTTLVNDILIDSLLHNWYSTLFVTPREKQTRTFSMQKLHPVIKYSPVFKKLMINNESIDNVFDKTYANNSVVFLRYAFLSADSIRGISANKIILDEVQDILWDNIAVIDEVLSGSEISLRRRTYAGTPKTLGNTLSKLFAKSTKHEYLVKCKGCNVWNRLSIKNIGKEGIICKKCGKLLGPPFEGQWVATNSAPDAQKMFGARLPQLFSPVLSWDEILDKLENYPPYQFHNEILAEPFDVGANPISEIDIKAACCDDPNQLPNVRTKTPGALALGIDWGHGEASLGAARGFLPTGYTVMCLVRILSNEKVKYLWIKKFKGSESDPKYQVKQAQLIAKMNKVDIVGADHGGGFYHNIDLRDKLKPIPLIEFNASGNVKEKVRWDPEADADKITFHRTRCMTDHIHELKDGKLIFPKWEDMREFIDDFTTVYIDHTRTGHMYYDHILPDDTFHATMIGKLAGKFFLTYLK